MGQQVAQLLLRLIAKSILQIHFFSVTLERVRVRSAADVMSQP